MTTFATGGTIAAWATVPLAAAGCWVTTATPLAALLDTALFLSLLHLLAPLFYLLRRDLAIAIGALCNFEPAIIRAAGGWRGGRKRKYRCGC